MTIRGWAASALMKIKVLAHGGKTAANLPVLTRGAGGLRNEGTT